LLGVKWTLALWNNRTNPAFFMDKKRIPFGVQHVREVQPRVLELNMAHHAHGIALSGISKEDRNANLETIISYFQNALDRQPTNVHTMDRLARSYRDLAGYLEEKERKRAERADEQKKKGSDEVTIFDEAVKERIRVLRKRADYLVEMSSKVPGADMDSLFAYGLQLMQKNCKNCVGGKPSPEEYDMLIKAQELFEQAISLGHTHSKIMLADLRYLCLKTGEAGAFEAVQSIDGEQGCNAGFHKFVYSLLNGKIKEATDAACSILKNPELDLDDKKVKKRLDIIQQFKQILEVYAKQQ